MRTIKKTFDLSYFLFTAYVNHTSSYKHCPIIESCKLFNLNQSLAINIKKLIQLSLHSTKSPPAKCDQKNFLQYSRCDINSQLDKIIRLNEPL